MKKYIIYLGILIVGLIFGRLLFGGITKEPAHDHINKANAKKMWTCSMHPQIMQPEKGDCPICGMDLIPAETGADGLLVNQFKLSKNAIALASIQTTVIDSVSKKGDNVVVLSGKVIENEETGAVQVSYFSGRIDRLYINFTGEKIKKGQLLASIYSPELIKAQQELLTTSTLKESQPSLYKAVRNKLKLWKLSETQINEIESSKKVKQNLSIYATVSGIVSEKLVAQGDYVKEGQPLLRITNLNTVWANFDAYEHQINTFKVGQSIAVSSNVYPNEIYKTKIAFIDPILNIKTRTVNVRAVLNNSEEKFKPAMFLKGKIEIASSKKTSKIIIPSTAVLWTGKRSIVYVKAKGNQTVFELREVALGDKFEDNYEIKKGLNFGDEIVTNGVFTVDASAQLKGKSSMMNHQKTLLKPFKISPVFKSKLQLAYDSYINLKNGLVKSDVAIVKKESNNLNENLSKINGTLLNNKDAHKQWMLLVKELKKTSKRISNSSKIDEQRKEFKTLSEYFITAVQTFGINEVTYKQHCPMVNKDKGAYWLSKEKKVLNPYYGEMMLKCGEVKQIIK